MTNNTDGNLAALRQYERELDRQYAEDEAREEFIYSKVESYMGDLALVCEAFSEMPVDDLKRLAGHFLKADCSNNQYAAEEDMRAGNLARTKIIGYMERLAEYEWEAQNG